MSHHNFKHQNFLDFSPHPFDVGNPFGKWQDYEDNHFIPKLLKLKEQQYEKYYHYHSDDFVKENKGTGEQFFKVVWGLVQNWIDILKRKDPTGSSHPNDIIKINKLNIFHGFMTSIDEWNARPAGTIKLKWKGRLLYKGNSLKIWKIS